MSVGIRKIEEKNHQKHILSLTATKVMEKNTTFYYLAIFLLLFFVEYLRMNVVYKSLVFHSFSLSNLIVLCTKRKIHTKFDLSR